MTSEIEKSGIPERELIEKSLPDPERRAAGPYVVVECWQRIPCDPCVAACPLGAIAEMENINDLPKVDHGICTGCGVCIAKCPGLAVFVVDETWGADDEALILMPYEFAPLPEKGDVLPGLDRAGNPVCDARIIRVRGKKGGTPVVSAAVPVDFIHAIRALRPK